MISSKNTKTAVITGVSSGIGRAIASKLMEDGWSVFGSVRKEADGEAALDALGDGFTPLLFDVTDDDSIKAAADEVEAILGGRTLDGLINNAGIAVAGPIRYIPLDDIKYQFDVNVYGPVRVTQAFLPLLGADSKYKGQPGKIVNMSSVAGKIAGPFMSPYSMSKHALEAFGDALRRELLVHGIDVITVGPGAVKTPIWAKGDDLDLSLYEGTEYFSLLERMRTSMKDYGNTGLEADEIGDLVASIMRTQRPATRYAILKNKFLMYTLPRMLPSRTLDGILAGRFGIKKRKR